MHLDLHNWEKKNKQMENSLATRGLVACITGRSQQRLSKLLQEIKGIKEDEKCPKITGEMIRFESDDYQHCGFCLLWTVWQYFSEVIKISIEFNNKINPSSTSNTLIPKLIQACTQEHWKIKGEDFQDEVDLNVIPDFKKFLKDLSNDGIPNFNFERNYLNATTAAENLQPRYDAPCHILHRFFKRTVGLDFKCYEIILYVILAFFVFPLLVGIILHYFRYWLDLRLEEIKAQNLEQKVS